MLRVGKGVYATGLALFFWVCASGFVLATDDVEQDVDASLDQFQSAKKKPKLYETSSSLSRFAEECVHPEYAFTPLLGGKALRHKIEEANAGDREAQDLIALYDYYDFLPPASWKYVSFGQDIPDDLKGGPCLWGLNLKEWVAEDLRRCSFVLNGLGCLLLGHPEIMSMITQKALEDRDSEALFHLCLFAQEGLIDELGDDQEAQLKLIQKSLNEAAKQGHPKAIYYGSFLRSKRAELLGPTLMEAWQDYPLMANNALEKGYRAAASLLAKWYLKGQGYPQDLSLALNYALLSTDCQRLSTFFLPGVRDDALPNSIERSQGVALLRAKLKKIADHHSRDLMVPESAEQNDGIDQLSQRLLQYLEHLTSPGLLINIVDLQPQWHQWSMTLPVTSGFAYHKWQIRGQSLFFCSFGEDNVTRAHEITNLITHQAAMFHAEGKKNSADLIQALALSYLTHTPERNMGFRASNRWVDWLDEEDNSEEGDSSSEFERDTGDEGMLSSEEGEL